MRLRRLNQSTLTSECVGKNLNATVFKLLVLASLFLFLYRHTSEGKDVSIKQYSSSSSTNILYLNTLYQ